MSHDFLGPRRKTLLRFWSSHIATTSSGKEFDFTETSRTERTQRRAESFVQNPTEDGFRSIWSTDALSTTLTRPAARVLENWDDIEGLAQTIADMRTASAFDDAWEDVRITGW